MIVTGLGPGSPYELVSHGVLWTWFNSGLVEESASLDGEPWGDVSPTRQSLPRVSIPSPLPVKPFIFEAMRLIVGLGIPIPLTPWGSLTQAHGFIGILPCGVCNG